MNLLLFFSLPVYKFHFFHSRVKVIFYLPIHQHLFRSNELKSRRGPDLLQDEQSCA